MLIKIVILIFASSILLSCTVSDTSPKLLLKPEGEKVRISFTESRDVLGELLSITETTIYIDSQQHIYALTIETVSNVEVVEYNLHFREEMKEQLKYYCRYPQGLTDTQWRRLLAHYQQEQPTIKLDSIMDQDSGK